MPTPYTCPWVSYNSLSNTCIHCACSVQREPPISLLVDEGLMLMFRIESKASTLRRQAVETLWALGWGVLTKVEDYIVLGPSQLNLCFLFWNT
jgi:hypothetical protein